MARKIEKVKASTLLLDYDLYPREKIDPYHTREMKETLKAGGKLPPILVDRKSNRIVDGFHRVRAYQGLYGADTEIPTIFKEWKDEASMFLEAIELNATHGRALTAYDKARCIARAETLKLEPELVASALKMTVDRVGELKAARFAQYKSEPAVLKRTASHLAGEDLTYKQVKYNVKAGGMNQSFYINQVIAMLEANTVDWESESVKKGLRKLFELLEKALKVKV